MIKSFAQLYNFNGDFDKISLENNIKIRKITEFEKQQLKEMFDKELTISISQQIDYFKYGIFYEREIDNNDEVQVIKKVVLYLRLYKNGDVNHNGILSILPADKKRGLFSHSMCGSIGKNYYLSKDSINNLKRLFKKLYQSKVDINQPVFNRFFNLAKNAWPEESILDYIIIIESLFGENTQEITYKLSMRVSYILSQVFNDSRLKVFDNIHNSYSKIRSKLVHAGKIKLNHNELMKYRAILEDYCRKLLLLYVLNENMFNDKKFNRNVDKAINLNQKICFQY